MSNKFEQLLDYLVNEEMDKANELFHEIVVEKSREIYENLIAEEAEEEEEMDESTEEVDEASEEDDEEELDEETTLEIGGDPADALGGDVAAPGAEGDFGDDLGGDDAMGGEEPGDLGGMGDGTPEERIDDLEDALEELKAEFEALMAGEQDEPEHDDMFGGDEDGEEGDDEEGGEEADDEGDDEEEDADEGMPFEGREMTREYVEKIGKDWDKNAYKTEDGGTNSKSVGLQNPKGRPTTTASAHNILGQKGGEAGVKGGEGLVGGKKGEFTKGVEKNISSSSKSSFGKGDALSKVPGGHGAEKKGAGEGQGWGSGKGDKAGQTGDLNTRSIVDRKQ